MAEKEVKTRSLSLNYILYNLRTCLNVLIPLIVFPYVTRILGPEKLGKINFAESIIGYFIIFSQLGIRSYATRELARNRDNIEIRSCIFWEVTTILLFTTSLASICYFILILFVPRFSVDLILYIVIFPNLIFDNLNYEWFYTAIEDQVFITRRFILVKVLQIVLIFTLIKAKNHYIIYAGIAVGLNSISAFFNIFHLRKYIKFKPLNQLQIKRHIRLILIIFSSVIATKINRVLDVTMIGTMINEESVSFYNVANRIVMIARDLILSIIFVLTPRIENVFKKGDYETYKHYLNISLSGILMLGFPVTVGIVLLAPEIVSIIAGELYTSSILSMQLLSPIIIIVGLTNIVVSLILFPNHRENMYTVAVSISAALNCLFNLIMIPRMGINGAILGTVLSSLILLIITILFGLSFIIKSRESFSMKELFKYIIATLSIVAIILCIKHFIPNNILVVICSLLITIPFYFLLLILLKSIYILDFKKMFFMKTKKNLEPQES